ncbi:MAG: ERF family protein, partial [Gordonibacter sp.]
MADSINSKLLAVQQTLKVEKGHYNEFGGFWSRSKEDILEAAKPICHEVGCTITCDDHVRMLENGWVYVVSTATLTDSDTGDSIERHGYARETEAKTKMDPSQITGSASSYAGKRALGNLFAIDDSTDADTGSEKPAPPANGPFIARCRSCGMRMQFFNPEQMAAYRCCPNP